MHDPLNLGANLTKNQQRGRLSPVARAEQALEVAKAHATANRISYSIHAQQRMEQRGLHHRDVRNAICTATLARIGDSVGKWKLSGGVDCEGVDTSVVVAFEGVNSTLIVTVF
jgi:hypothetical protein